MVTFTFPQESAEARRWLMLNQPVGVPLKAQQPQQRPPLPPPASPINISSDSESDIVEEDNLSDLVAPSWEIEPIDMEM